MNGLEGAAFFKHFVENKRVQLFSLPEVRDVIWDERLKGSMGQFWNGSEFCSLTFDDYFAFTPLETVRTPQSALLGSRSAEPGIISRLARCASKPGAAFSGIRATRLSTPSSSNSLSRHISLFTKPTSDRHTRPMPVWPVCRQNCGTGCDSFTIPTDSIRRRRQ